MSYPLVSDFLFLQFIIYLGFWFRENYYKKVLTSNIHHFDGPKYMKSRKHGKREINDQNMVSITYLGFYFFLFLLYAPRLLICCLLHRIFVPIEAIENLGWIDSLSKEAIEGNARFVWNRFHRITYQFNLWLWPLFFLFHQVFFLVMIISICSVIFDFDLNFCNVITSIIVCSVPTVGLVPTHIIVVQNP